jgi:hypothetical protein
MALMMARSRAMTTTTIINLAIGSRGGCNRGMMSVFPAQLPAHGTEAVME